MTRRPESIEDLAVRRAAYAGLRWEDADETMRAYYRRVVQDDIERNKAMEAERPKEPPRMPPFSFGDKLSQD